MASRTFTWDTTAGSPQDWTTAGNWTGVGSGYPGDSVGVNVDTVIIPTGQDKCYVNAAIEIYDLTITGVAANTLVELQANLEVTHDLLITSGIMNLGAGSYTLTVGGDLSLLPIRVGGTGLDATLTCGNADVIAGKLQTWGFYHSGGYDPKVVFTGGTGDHTYGSIQFLVGTNVVLSAGVTDITGEYGGAAFRDDVQTGYNTYDNGGGTVKFTSSSLQRLYSTSVAANDFKQFYNLILEKTTSTLQGLSTVGFHIKVENDLTITSGILNTNTTTGVNHDLTVEGKITTISGGTLTLNGSTVTSVDYFSNAGIVNMDSATVSVGGFLNRGGGVANLTTEVLTLTNESGSYVMTDDGTYHHNSGTVHIDWNTGGTNGNTVMDMNTARLYNLIIEMNSSSFTTQWYQYLQVDNDLTINRGKLYPHSSSPDYANISGSLIIDNEGTFGVTGANDPRAITMGNLYMMSGSTLVLTSGTTTVTNQGSNATGRTWFTRTNSTDPGPRTLTIPSGSMLMLPGGGRMEFDDSDYYYNITCSGTFDTKNAHLHIDNDFRCNGWGPNGASGYHFTVGNDFTKIGTATFNSIDTGSTWTVSGNMTIEDGKIDVHGRDGDPPGDVNLKLYGNLINNGGNII